MAYLAFYRTFRPTTFDEVVRQEHIVRILKNQIESGKIGHAYLFCGPRGTGKTTLAKIFARAINCQSPVNFSPCGKCEACKALAEGSNLDISEIDAASNNGVDEMRDLREKVQYPPVAGKYKVYIIDEVHMLTASAFNAVLKTLEEPPRHAVFILATTEPQKIPATILSRCMRFDFKLIPQRDLEELIKSVFVKTGKEFEDEAVSAIARAGAGSARDCLSIADMCASYSTGKLTYDDVSKVLGTADVAEVAEIVGHILAEDPAGAIGSVERTLSGGRSVGTLLKDMLTFMNQLAIAKVCKTAREIINLPESTFALIAERAAEADGHKILRVTEILAAAENDMRYSASGRITLETAVYKCSMPQADYDIDALIGKINALERKLESGKYTVAAPVQTAQPAQTAQPVQANQPVQTAQPVQPAQAAQSAPAKPQDGADDTPRGEKPARGGSHIPSWFTHNPRSSQGAKNSGERSPASSLQPDREPSPFDSPFGSQEDRPAVQPQQSGQQGGQQGGQQSGQQGGQQSAQSPQPARQSGEAVQPALWDDAPAAPVRTGSLSEEEKRAVFGKFIRCLRTTHKNAVLFTLCMNLRSTFEGDKLVLITESEAVQKGLNRPDNSSFISAVLAELGVTEHEVRFAPKQASEYEQAISELTDNFSGTDIDIK